jgi:hypothetical protein
VTGTGHNNTQNFDFQVVGTLDNGGNIQGTISGGTAGTLSGTLAIAQDGHLKGTVIQTQGQNTISLNFDLVKQ